MSARHAPPDRYPRASLVTSTYWDTHASGPTIARPPGVTEPQACQFGPPTSDPADPLPGHQAALQRPPVAAPRRKHTDANRSSMGTAPSMVYRTQWKPALMPVHRRQMKGGATSLRVARLPMPPPPVPPLPARALPHPEGARYRGVANPLPQQPTPPPPPLTLPGRHTAPDTRAHPSGDKRPRARQGDAGTVSAPLTLIRRSTGPGQETRRVKNRMEQLYRCPARIPRVVRTPLQQRGGGRVHRGCTGATGTRCRPEGQPDRTS